MWICVCVHAPAVWVREGGAKSGEKWYVLLQVPAAPVAHKRRAQPFEQSESGDPAAAERFCQCSDDPMHSRAKRWLSSETQLQRKR